LRLDKSGAAAYKAPPASNLNQILVQFHTVTNSNISLINSVKVTATNSMIIGMMPSVGSYLNGTETQLFELQFAFHAARGAVAAVLRLLPLLLRCVV
jgi:hypothetical protein